MAPAIVLLAIRWLSRSCVGSDNASRQSTRSSRGGPREQAGANAGNADACFPTSPRRLVFSCPHRSVAQAEQLAFDSVAPARALRMAGRGRQCEALERAVRPLTAFAAGNMASDRLWFRRHVARSASLYRRPSDKCLPRAPILPYFPCSPSVTRSALFPRHITPSRTDRAPGTPILRTASFCFSRTPPPTRCVGSPLRKMQLLPWERGALASLRARVSRGQSGQIQPRRKSNGTLHQHRHSERLPG